MTTEYLIGDARSVLGKMEAETVDCVITSPPYFGLRQYTDNSREIGREETPDEYVQNLLVIFGQCWRVLKPEGTLWLNLGDSYSQSGGIGDTEKQGTNRGSVSKPDNRKGFGIPGKNLIGIPWRVAFALQADGWIIRNDIIWHKRNAMPESVRDRFTKAHEHIFMLSRKKRYYFNQAAIKEPATYAGKDRGGSTKRYSQNGEGMDRTRYETRNKRDVWSVSTRAFKGAHFATFSVQLILPAVLAGCPEGGTILDPFSGAGTVGLAAKQNNRNSVLIDINAEYHEIARRRIDAWQPK